MLWGELCNPSPGKVLGISNKQFYLRKLHRTKSFHHALPSASLIHTQSAEQFLGSKKYIYKYVCIHVYTHKYIYVDIFTKWTGKN